jgi:plasmid rolling circle replication initiator protein Rep
MVLNSHDYDDIIDRALDRMAHKLTQYNHWTLLDPQVKAEMVSDKRKRKTAYQRKFRARKK